MTTTSYDTLAYSSEEWLAKENELIFTKLWNFVCPYSIVRKDKSYFCFLFNSREYVLHNICGKLVAYLNSCPHRGNRIMRSNRGNASPTCAYHGWTLKYTQSLEYSIPFNDSYVHIDVKSVGNQFLKVNVFAGLVFISKPDVAHDLSDQIPLEIQHSLNECLGNVDNQVLHSRFYRNFNWKLILENLRDPLHPHFLHRLSLLQGVDVDLSYLEESNYSYDVDDLSGSLIDLCKINSSFHTHQLLKKHDNLDLAITSSELFHGYLNWLIFPNLHVSSSNSGKTFLLELYTPSAPGQTMIDLFIFTSKRKRRLPKTYLHQVYRHALTVLNEDFSVVEGVQLGTQNLHKSFIYGLSDNHLAKFARSINYLLTV